MNKKSSTILAVLVLATLASGVIAGDHDRRPERLSAKLKPTEEVPALSSAARGWFKATIDEANQSIAYELSYDALEGTVSQAHIHIGARHTLGGISVFLCGNPPTVPPAAVPQPPACPPAPATITGILSPANIVGPGAQGIEPSSDTAHEFDELVAMLRQGVTYANVHTSRFQGGEIRGQIGRASRH